MENVVGTFGVPSKSENGRKPIERERERESRENFFEMNDIHKFTVVSGVGLLGFALLQDKKRLMLLNINIFRGSRTVVSNHYLVVFKLRCLRKWVGGR